MEKILCLKITVQLTQKFLKLSSKNKFNLNFIRNDIKIKRNNEFNLIPLNFNLKDKENLNLINKIIEEFTNTIVNPQFETKIPIEIIEKEILESDFKNIKKTQSIENELKKFYPEEIINLIPKSFDIIGDIAIIEFDIYGDLTKLLETKYGNQYSIDDLKKKLAQTILNQNINIKTVLNKIGRVEGEFRLRKFEYILGENKTYTRHKENGCIFELDISKVFFNPRLSYERLRISKKKFKENSIILDCFAGVGPFSIEISSKNNVNVFACEKNPDACYFFKRNIILNKKRIIGKIELLCNDFKILYNFECTKKLINNVDYIIMNLPEKNLEFIKYIKPYIKFDGTELIIYLLEENIDPIKKGIENLKRELLNNGLEIKRIIFSRIVKNFAPKIFMIVIEVEIKL